MPLTVPIPLALGRFARLPQRTHEVWQGGLVRLPMWIDHPTDPTGPPYRPTGAVWVSLRTGLMHLAIPPEGSPASAEFALGALIEFGMKWAKELAGRPSHIEVRDSGLRDALAASLDSLSTRVVLVDDLPAVREVIANLEASTSGSERIPGLLDVPGVTLERHYKLDAPQGVRGRNSDNTLIRERLGWAPAISLEDGLAATYAWVHDQVAATIAQS